ncbi:Ig-like domain-containing protein [Roseinatronobacter alkalisoli]|uniref:Ig-like domain-containing protein n=1 Tax=Roseinatronobacter alkalisoli TaxID=3028235 RepID=A0ABT5TDQ8_9RHOB|nr:Ig-like domain-containing protein [Roseinatronobacter sp. HJB301]MDD7973260.1 Ig-like domain-containing protein [Roseinatronobacter sp. HJB301]
MPPRSLQAILFAACIGAMAATAPALSQETIEIPRQQIEALPDLPVPEFDIDLSTPEGLFRSMEEIARTDWTGTLPEAVTEAILGASPIEAHAPVVWEMQATGAWNETLQGAGILNVFDHVALRSSGRQFLALLDSDARDWPLQVFVMVPNDGPGVTWHQFAGAGTGSSTGGTGVGAVANHMFDAEQIIGFATPQGMRSPSFTELEDAYYYTQVEGGHVRLDERGNAYRLSFAANVVEYHSDDREPTGRRARISGWICEAAAWETDPDSCLYEPLEVFASTPAHDRENVNYREPAVEVTFSDPVEPVSLTEGFSLSTRDASGERLTVDGAWMQAGAQDYAFVPDFPLRSGTIYEARITGGEDGVRAIDSGEVLEEDYWWRFSTMINLDEQAPADDPAFDMRVFQTVRDAPLVMDKPTLTRVYVDWLPHDDIHPAWQPESYPMDIALAPLHPRLVGQGGTPPGAEGELRIYRSSGFGDQDRRHARNTINFFGWEPEWNGFTSELELVASPYDPFPQPLPETLVEEVREVENWPVWPDDLVFRYGVIEVNEWEDGPPTEMRQVINSVIADAEELATAIMPVRAARGMRLGLRIGPEQLGTSGNYLNQLEHLMRNELPHALGSDNEVVMLFAPMSFAGPGLAFSALSRVSDLDRRMALLSPEDHVCYFGDEYVMAFVHEVLHTYGMWHNPAESDEIDLVQECLRINSATGHVDQTIEGFRIDASGLDGWNKSAQEGNEESHDTLVSVMWPYLTSARQVWISEWEYEALQQSFGTRWERFGSRDLPVSGIRFADLPGQPAILTDARAPRPEYLTVLGVVALDGSALEIDAITLRPPPQVTSRGPLTAELLDVQGRVVSQARFGGELDHHDHDHAHTHAHTAEVVQHHHHDDEARWPLFSVALEADPQARRLVIRRGDTVLAERAAPGVPPRLEVLHDAPALELGEAPVTLSWEADGAGQLRHTVRYSPTGGPPWDVLALRQNEQALTIAPEDLRAGPAPTLRIVSDDGFHHAARDLPLRLNRAPVPRLLAGAAGGSLTLEFDTLIDPAALSEAVQLHDSEGVKIPFKLHQGRRQHLASLLPDAHAQAGAPYSVRLGAGLADIFGNTLQEEVVLLIEPAPQTGLQHGLQADPPASLFDLFAQ